MSTKSLAYYWGLFLTLQELCPGPTLPLLVQTNGRERSRAYVLLWALRYPLGGAEEVVNQTLRVVVGGDKY